MMRIAAFLLGIIIQSSAIAVVIELDPGKSLMTTGFGDPPTPMNNNFAVGRGVVFEVNSSLQLTGAGLWIDPILVTLTFELFQIDDPLSSDLVAGATFLTGGTTQHSDTGSGLAFYDVEFSGVIVDPGAFYYLNASFPEAV